jgi:hypothetical protein
LGPACGHAGVVLLFRSDFSNVEWSGVVYSVQRLVRVPNMCRCVFSVGFARRLHRLDDGGGQPGAGGAHRLRRCGNRLCSRKRLGFSTHWHAAKISVPFFLRNLFLHKMKKVCILRSKIFALLSSALHI